MADILWQVLLGLRVNSPIDFRLRTYGLTDLRTSKMNFGWLLCPKHSCAIWFQSMRGASPQVDGREWDPLFSNNNFRNLGVWADSSTAWWKFWHQGSWDEVCNSRQMLQWQTTIPSPSCDPGCWLPLVLWCIVHGVAQSVIGGIGCDWCCEFAPFVGVVVLVPCDFVLWKTCHPSTHGVPCHLLLVTDLAFWGI